MNEENTKPLRTAVVAIIGRPSAGKSTFLNTACQEPVSIVSPIPQTTRNAIKGIVNTSLSQLIFIDTPGYHDSDKKLNLRLKSVTESQLSDIDCVLYIIDSTRATGEEEIHTAELLKNIQAKTVVAINKTDLPTAKAEASRKFVAEHLPEIPADHGHAADSVPALYPVPVHHLPLRQAGFHYQNADGHYRQQRLRHGQPGRGAGHELFPHCIPNPLRYPVLH